MLRCSATTAAALPHLPVSLACFGSGLFNELENTHDELETEGEGEGEGGGKKERECVWRQSHGQSHIKGSINTQSPSTIHPTASAAHLISGSASGPSVVAHMHQQRTQQSREQGEGSASSAVAARSDGVGGGAAWTTAACCAARTEGHSTKQCDVGPCSRCATRTLWKKESAHGSV